MGPKAKSLLTALKTIRDGFSDLISAVEEMGKELSDDLASCEATTCAHDEQHDAPRMKTCEKCGQQFESRYPNQHYCSDQCKKQAKDARRYARKTTKVDSARAVSNNVCVICKKTFETTSSSKKCCSDACSKIYRNFTLWRRSHKDKDLDYYLENARYHKQKQPVVCKVCGKEFIPKRKNAVICSRKCQAEAFRQMAKKRWENKPVNAAPTPIVTSSAKPTEPVTTEKKIPPATKTSTCKCCNQSFIHPADTDPRYCKKCLDYYGLQECIAIEKEETEKKTIEKVYKTSRHKVCARCAAFFEDTSPSNARMFCDRCTEIINKKHINNSTRKRKKFH